MHILLAITDAFSVQGGGQTFFSEYIKNNPDITFSFFATRSDERVVLPSNARVIPLVDRYRAASKQIRLEADLSLGGVSLAGKEDDVYALLDMAASVAGSSFDAVEIPDFLPYAALLPPALRLMGASIGCVVLSMHGTLSDALVGNWAPEVMFDVASLRKFERALYLASDLRYGIGRPYTEQWTRETGREAHLLDISTVFDFSAYRRQRSVDATWPSGVVPDLVFVGRQERWKGPDLFIDLASRLPTGSYSNLQMIGGRIDLFGHDSNRVLARMARMRRVDVIFRTLPREQLLGSYAEAPWFVALPSRHDTFNLSGLEAALSGCPIAITREAGLSSYLDEALPDLPVVRMDAADLNPAIEQISEVLGEYGKVRRRIADYLRDIVVKEVGASRADIWDKPNTPDLSARTAVDDLCAELFGAIEAKAKGKFSIAASERFADELVRIVGSDRAPVLDVLRPLPDQVARLEDLQREVQEGTGGRLTISDGRLATITAELAPYVFSADRVAVFDFLAELEARRGNDLLHATYKARSLRLAGGAGTGVVDQVAAQLVSCGFPQEADVVRWLYGPKPDVAAARAYLENVQTRHRQVPSGDIETRVDRRRPEPPKVSIIVSLYRAADKLPTFLGGLARMTERTRTTCEVILVDSHSPDDTQEVAARELDALAARGRELNVLYVRTTVRETIQRAWNRGIGLARADYVAFLGCDEMNRSDAFDIMVDYLDAHPHVDWVQGTALVTEVGPTGAFERDIMAYDRTFDSDVVQLLDTCFIGYVGALYRKAVHDRVGYYDESFRGAGDTEFKNRALPFMRAVTLPVCLGFFLNYPDERVTASPAVEIEDLRAWYLHRSVAGIGYLFDRRGVDDALDLARRCLRYRKSYMDEDSTDLELAAAIHAYIEGVALDRLPAVDQEAVHDALAAYRTLDGISARSRASAGLELGFRARETVETSARSISDAARILRGAGWVGAFTFRNDNRSHQHFGIWPSTLANPTVTTRPDVPVLVELGRAGHGLHEPAFTASPSLTLEIVVESEAVEGLVCRLDGRSLDAKRDQAGRVAFTRPGRRGGTASWTPLLEFIDGAGAPVRGLIASLVVDLKGITDRQTGDRVLAVENLSYVEPNDSGEPGHRWTGPGEAAAISVPVIAPDAGRLEVTIFNTGPNRMDEVRVVVDGEEVLLEPDHPGWVDPATIAIPLPVTDGTAHEIRLVAARTASSGQDARKLGLAWGRARLVFPLRLSI